MTTHTNERSARQSLLRAAKPLLGSNPNKYRLSWDIRDDNGLGVVRLSVFRLEVLDPAHPLQVTSTLVGFKEAIYHK